MEASLSVHRVVGVLIDSQRPEFRILKPCNPNAEINAPILGLEPRPFQLIRLKQVLLWG